MPGGKSDKSAMQKNELRQRVVERLAMLKTGAVEAASRIPNLERNYIRDLVEGKKQSFNQSKLPLVAQALEWSVPELLGSKEISAPPERRSRELVRVPLLDRVSAGKLKQPLSQVHAEDVPLLAFADLGKGDFFALTVEGDSMDRIAPDGAMIVVDRSDTMLVSNKPYVLSDRGQVTFKVWKPNPPRWAPASTNPSHEPIFVKTKEAAERMVVGRVKRAVVDL